MGVKINIGHGNCKFGRGKNALNLSLLCALLCCAGQSALEVCIIPVAEAVTVTSIHQCARMQLLYTIHSLEGIKDNTLSACYFLRVKFG
jgi:hypothetical protein